MIDKLNEKKAYSISPHEILQKLNELIDEFNYHIHGVEEQDESITTEPLERKIKHDN